MSVEIESEIKTPCTTERKELHSQLNRYKGMKLFTCGGDKFGPFQRYTFDTKSRGRRGRKGDN